MVGRFLAGIFCWMDGGRGEPMGSPGQTRRSAPANYGLAGSMGLGSIGAGPVLPTTS